MFSSFHGLVHWLCCMHMITSGYIEYIWIELIKVVFVYIIVLVKMFSQYFFCSHSYCQILETLRRMWWPRCYEWRLVWHATHSHYKAYSLDFCKKNPAKPNLIRISLFWMYFCFLGHLLGINNEWACWQFHDGVLQYMCWHTESSLDAA